MTNESAWQVRRSMTASGVETYSAQIRGGLGSLALFLGKHAGFQTATRPPSGGLGKDVEAAGDEMRGEQDHVDHLANFKGVLRVLQGDPADHLERLGNAAVVELICYSLAGALP
jgi:hypothetical protein